MTVTWRQAENLDVVILPASYAYLVLGRSTVRATSPFSWIEFTLLDLQEWRIEPCAVREDWPLQVIIKRETL